MNRTERQIVRVIAGQARGQNLKSLDSERLRPTSDKVKSALFSYLEAQALKLGFEAEFDEADELHYAAARAWPRVLDLYAGSGALGIEALSRGAERVEFVESNRAARQLIAENLRQTGLAERAVVHAMPVERVVSTLSGPYDLILADPPYADTEAGRVLAGLGASPLLSQVAVLVWEHHRDRQAPAQLGRLHLARTLRHGIATLSCYRLAPTEEGTGGPADPLDPAEPDRVEDTAQR